MLNYETSTDHAKLWLVSQARDVICLVTLRGGNEFAAVARKRGVYVEIKGTANATHGYGATAENFATDCVKLNLRWLVPNGHASNLDVMGEADRAEADRAEADRFYGAM